MSFFGVFSRSKLDERDRRLLEILKENLGFKPKNLPLFKQAFIHKSNNDITTLESNERLEYLGDTVLSTVVGEYLYYKYPKEDEGFLTKMRAKIVKRVTLNSVAREWELDTILGLYNRTTISESMLGNALEALIGAIYIEKGYEVTRRFITVKILLNDLDLGELESSNENYKSILLEYCQKENKKLDYPMLRKYRANNKDMFQIGARIDKEIIADGSGYNKKSAEQLASKKTLQKLGIL